MNDLISILGYSKNSPFKGNPYLDIHTPDGLIDMSDTEMDLIGIDNKGNKKKMKAGAKNPYKFEGNIVREIPAGNPYQKGGITAEQLFKFIFDDEEEIKDTTKVIPTVEEIESNGSEQVRRIADDEQNQLAMSIVNSQRNPYKSASSMITQPDAPFVAGNTDLYKEAKKYEGAPYKFAGTTREGIDCSGYVCKVVGLPRTSSEEIVKNAPNFRGFSGNINDFSEGTVVGFDTGSTSFDKGRKYGMDHVGVIIRNPQSRQLEYTHSAGSTGVKTMTIPEMLKKYKNSRIFLGDYGQKTK